MTHYRKRRSEVDDAIQPLRDATGTILRTGTAVVGVGVGLAGLSVAGGLASGLLH